MAKGTDIEKVAETADMLLGAIPLEVNDSAGMQRSIIERNLRAETVDDVFDEQTTVACKDYVGNPIRVGDVRLAEGELDGEATVYMLIDAVDMNTGEALVMNTGAPQVTSKLMNLKLKGALPIEVCIVEAASARRGRNAVLSLKRIPEDHGLPH